MKNLSLSRILIASAFSTATVFAFGCEVSTGGAAVAAAPVDTAPVVYTDDTPPSTFIATAEPVTYNGQPAYYYHDHWYYKDQSGRWGYYRTEPAELAQRRTQAPPVRRNYARNAPPQPVAHQELHAPPHPEEQHPPVRPEEVHPAARPGEEHGPARR